MINNRVEKVVKVLSLKQTLPLLISVRYANRPQTSVCTCVYRLSAGHSVRHVCKAVCPVMAATSVGFNPFSKTRALG